MESSAHRRQHNQQSCPLQLSVNFHWNPLRYATGVYSRAGLPFLTPSCLRAPRTKTCFGALVFHGDKYKWSLQFTAVNLTNKVALYNFLSTFGGTRYVHRGATQPNWDLADGGGGQLGGSRPPCGCQGVRQPALLKLFDCGSPRLNPPAL